MHVTVDGRRSGVHTWNGATAKDFCLQAIRLADMTLISGPHVASWPPSICAIAILGESHVAVHLDRDSGEAHLELFSCKDFPRAPFVDLCVSHFGLEGVQTRLIPRAALTDPRALPVTSTAPRGEPRRLRDLRPSKHGFLDGLLHRLHRLLSWRADA